MESEPPPLGLRNAGDLNVHRGGLIHHLARRIGLVSDARTSPVRLIAGVVLVTWVPLLVLSLLEGRALENEPRASFLMDFAMYARCFLVGPLLILTGISLGPKLSEAGLHFVQAGLVRAQDRSAFEGAIDRLKRWRDSYWPEAFLLALSVAGSWFLLPAANEGIGGGATWHALRNADGSLALTGLWYHAISIPLLQLLWFRSQWRVFLWLRFLFSVSRLKLNLVPTHADAAAGLGFLGHTHASFAVYGFLISSILAAEGAFRILFEQASLESLKVPFLVLLAYALLSLLGPLLMFLPALADVRRRWLIAYDRLVVRYNRAFHEKWVENGPPADEPLLGSGDIQSLADLSTSYRLVRETKVVPFDKDAVIAITVGVALPALALVLLVLPFDTILRIVGGAMR